jgi:hypothetical protein
MIPWNELFAPEAPETRGEHAHARAFEAVMVACVAAALWDWAFVIPHNLAVLEPAGIARYVDVSWMLQPGYAFANAALGSLLLGLGWMRAAPGAYLGALAALHLQYVARYCLGKVSHGSHLAALALLAFGVTDLLFRDAAPRRRAALGLCVLLFGIAYTLAGISKLAASGLRWPDGAHLTLWMHEKYVDELSSDGSAQWNAVQAALLAHRGLGTFGLWLGLLTELSAWSMWWRRPRRFVALGLIAMHTGIYVSMGILFLSNVALLLALSLPIAALVDRVVRPAQPAAIRPA